MVAKSLAGQDGTALVDQMKQAEVEDVDDQGQIRIRVRDDAPPLRSDSQFPIDLWYFDSDGMIVSLLLHANGATKQIQSIERYRLDGDKIHLLWPQLDQVRLGTPPGFVSV